MAVYYATKAFVVSFSEALANEVAGSGVTVTCLCPGPTRTEFQARAGMEETRLMRGRVMDARSVAKAGYDGLAQGRPLVIPGGRNRMLATAVRWLPRGVVVRAVRNIQENRRSPTE
jgi:short-subunit dehydrogenase